MTTLASTKDIPLKTENQLNFRVKDCKLDNNLMLSIFINFMMIEENI